jgi:hypothetical protein
VRPSSTGRPTLLPCASLAHALGRSSLSLLGPLFHRRENLAEKISAHEPRRGLVRMGSKLLIPPPGPTGREMPIYVLAATCITTIHSSTRRPTAIQADTDKPLSTCESGLIRTKASVYSPATISSSFCFRPAFFSLFPHSSSAYGKSRNVA